LMLKEDSTTPLQKVDSLSRTDTLAPRVDERRERVMTVVFFTKSRDKPSGLSTPLGYGCLAWVHPDREGEAQSRLGLSSRLPMDGHGVRGCYIWSLSQMVGGEILLLGYSTSADTGIDGLAESPRGGKFHFSRKTQQDPCRSGSHGPTNTQQLKNLRR